jgi:hypothetical protein
VSEVLAIMFRENGRATPYLLARWKAKGGLKPLQPAAIYVGGGYAKPVFRSLWKQAFPTREPIPTDAIATRDGRFTEAMLSIWLDT